MSTWNAGLLEGSALWTSLTDGQREAIEGRATWESLTADERRGLELLASEALSHDAEDAVFIALGPVLLTELQHRLIDARRALADAEARDAPTRELTATVKQLLDKIDKLAIKGTPVDVKRLTTGQVAKRMGLSKKSVERAMADALQAGIDPVWINAGSSRTRGGKSGKRRGSARWEADRVDEFFKELDRWRRSTSAARSSRSAGGPSRVSSAGAPARRSATQTGSSSRSKAPAASGATGSLRSLALSLSSKK